MYTVFVTPHKHTVHKHTVHKHTVHKHTVHKHTVHKHTVPKAHSTQAHSANSTQYTSTQCQKHTVHKHTVPKAHSAKSGQRTVQYLHESFFVQALCACVFFWPTTKKLFTVPYFTHSHCEYGAGGGGVVLVGSRVLLELRVTWFTTTSSTVTLMNWLFTVQLPQLLSA